MAMIQTASDSDSLRQIETRLNQILRLVALQMTSGLKQAPAIELLSTAGMDRNEIADLLHTTPSTVRATISKTAKKKQNA